MDWNLKLIFSTILFVTFSFVPAATECPEHNYTIGSKQFTWPRTPSSDAWIPSDCLNEKKLLIFRQCKEDSWTPNNIEFENLCKYENVEVPSYDCPYDAPLIQIKAHSICVLTHGGLRYDFVVDKTVCIQHGITTMELDAEEQAQLVSRLAQDYAYEYNGLFTLGARHKYPSKMISKNVDYDIEDVEIHDVRCGRYGMPLKFNNTVPVHCSEDECDNMCLTLDARTDLIHPIIHECRPYVITKPKNTFLHRIGCPDEHYRIEMDYIQPRYPDGCFSIQTFPEPIPVKDLDNANVVQTFCNGTIMVLNSREDVFLFKQLSEQVGLTDDNRCLFGLTPNDIVRYTDWDFIDASPINVYNWDKTVNYSRIIDETNYLTIKSNGQWTWAVDTVSCIACMVHTPIPFPSFQLTYNILQRKLELEVTNRDNLLNDNTSDRGFMCYSIFREIYSANVTIFPIAGSTSKYLIDDIGMGEYWCVGHDVIRRRYISSVRLFAYGFWFAFEVVRKCETNCSFSSTDLDRFMDIFNRKNNPVSIKDSMIVEHDAFDSSTEYTFTVHLSLTLYDSEVETWFTNSVNLANLTDYERETIFIYEELNRNLIDDESNEFNVKSIKSTEYCLHKSALSVEAIIWRIARIGEKVSPLPLCSSPTITRTCTGDHVHGAYWEELVDQSDCYTLLSESLVKLYGNMGHLYEIDDVIQSVKILLEENLDIVQPLDVYLTARILQDVKHVIFNDPLDIFAIYNSLMKIDENSLKISAALNSTNILLSSFDEFLLSHIHSSIMESSDFLQYGNASIYSPLVQTFILKTHVSLLSGIALYRQRYGGGPDVDFATYTHEYTDWIFNTFNTMNRFIDKDLVVGAFVPSGIRNTCRNMTVVITVFFNQKLFQSTASLTLFGTNGKLVSVNYLQCDGFSNISLLFESSRIENSTCEHWDPSGNTWYSYGCSLREIFLNDFQRMAMCDCSLLAHFRYLFHSYESGDTNTLTIITILTSAFSFFGTFGIFLTAVVFPQWRQEINSQIRIHFAASIALEMVLTILINLDFFTDILSSSIACVALGLVLHYSALVMFFWILIIVYFQFNQYVVVFNFNVSHLLLKLSVFVWGVPLLPLLLVLFLDQSLYVPMKRDEHKFCYPTGWAMYFGVVTPIAFVFVIISVVIIKVFQSLYIKARSSNCETEETKFRVGLVQVKWTALLFLTLGLTWAFRLSSKIQENDYLSYSFCAAATIKGLILFLYFIIFDSTVKSLWMKCFRKISRRVHEQ